MTFTAEEIERFRVVSQLACQVGGQELVRWMGKFNVQKKRPGDYVTQADFASQKAIRDMIRQHFPKHEFVGEENDGQQGAFEHGKLCWIVDPLDGTKNYIHGLYSFSVSVALVHCDDENGDQILAGTVLDPMLNECFSAGLGFGATLNEQLIQTSQERELADALLVCSFSSRVQSDSPEIKRFLNLLSRTGSIRRLGSAALNLCYLACGRLDAYWASSVHAWDVAAGALILREAGGDVVNLDGSPFELRDPKFLASASSDLRDAILPWLQIPDAADTVV